MNTKKYFEANKKLWNAWVGIHAKSKLYNLDGFKSGNTSLQPIELKEVGDVKGKTMLHLQCHFGLDTLSWSRLGAKATGIDFSEEGIKLAKSIGDELHIDAKFICSNIYDIENHINEKFDIVFTSYGTIGWLNDLQEWGRLISKYLKPGGFFYIVDFHNIMWMFDEKYKYFKYSYFFNEEPIVLENQGTYADGNADIKAIEYGWNHPLSDVINSLISNGLQIEFLHEYPFSVYDVFPDTVKGNDGFYRLKEMENIIPMMFSVKAKKSE
ncbi:MAG TPA: class I SAM-dependent methyltransferase [Ignavibacteria bacterium]|nr:class I SAM-dependent methyltransferase [Ignavibacteria bacterium]